MSQQYIPDWSSSMGDTFAPLSGEDDGLIELMWCNGHVVMQSQTTAVQRNKPPRPDDKAAPAAAAHAWFQYPVEEYPVERDDLFSELFGEAQAAVDGATDRDHSCGGGMMPPPPSRPWEEKACPGPGGDGGAPARTTATATDGGESSMLTIGSSFCGSNHVQTPPPPPPRQLPPKEDVAAAATVSSSATRSRSCTTRSEQQLGTGAAPATHRSGKRKQSDATDAEDVEFESADATCERAHKMTTTAKRRRAAEVHNLSERRRRDRINEKMKALQDLIPHCNKTDKASMLDEAIEYLKSLQLQLQIMWMGGGMAAAAPMVFPAGVHHQYMQGMVAGGPLPTPHVASMPGMPPPFMAAPPVPDLYARYLAGDHPPPPPPLVAQPPPPYTVRNQQHCLQATTMGFYQRQNHHHHPATLLPLPPLPPPPAAMPAAAPSDGMLNKKYENCAKPEIQSMIG